MPGHCAQHEAPRWGLITSLAPHVCTKKNVFERVPQSFVLCGILPWSEPFCVRIATPLQWIVPPSKLCLVGSLSLQRSPLTVRL